MKTSASARLTCLPVICIASSAPLSNEWFPFLKTASCESFSPCPVVVGKFISCDDHKNTAAPLCGFVLRRAHMCHPKCKIQVMRLTGSLRGKGIFFIYIYVYTYIYCQVSVWNTCFSQTDERNRESGRKKSLVVHAFDLREDCLSFYSTCSRLPFSFPPISLLRSVPGNAMKGGGGTWQMGRQQRVPASGEGGNGGDGWGEDGGVCAWGGGRGDLG